MDLYHPGEGTTPHFNLLERFEDGILRVTGLGSCVTDIRKSEESYGVFLPEESMIAFTGEWYEWMHEIERIVADYVNVRDR